MKITRELLRKWGACYNPERIAELVPKAGLTPLEVAALDIPVNVKLCVLLREDIIPAPALRLLACSWAQKACLAADCYDERSSKVIAVARRFARGDATEAELGEAWAAARAAACSAWSAVSADAAAAAAAEAAEAVAWTALRSAAEAAVGAALAAVRSAVSLDAAAASVVRAMQLDDVVHVLKVNP